MTESDLVLTAAFAVAAFVYASVGHAGASGYLAAMALVGVAPAQMKPQALLLNLVVASIALVQFARAGCFNFRLFWPFALGSVPLALLGGAASVSGTTYRLLVAAGLLLAAVRLALAARPSTGQPLKVPPWPLAVALGAGIGLLAGITGTGGGIYLSPLILFFRWGEARETGGTAAAFILVNSVAGLAGARPPLDAVSAAMPVWMLAVALCGALGAWLGSRHASPPVFRRLLALVLVVAAVKLVGS